MTVGLTSAIMDTRTPQIVEAVKAADLLLGHDEWGSAWIAAHRARQAADKAAAQTAAAAADGSASAPTSPQAVAAT
jgi:5-methyltetrahydrofolate--homocysteine methyltransferase